MAYIGKSPANAGHLTSEQEIIATDVIGGGVGQRIFTLTTTAGRKTDIIVSINGVGQPASAFTLSGTTLTFPAPAAVAVGDVLRVQHIGYKPSYFQVQPGSVDIAHLSATGTPSASVALKGNNTWGQAGGPSLGTDAIIRTNGQTIVADITFAGTENGMSAGPITVADTKTVTVTDGSTWTIF
jgi:hypothetical protein